MTPDFSPTHAHTWTRANQSRGAGRGFVHPRRTLHIDRRRRVATSYRDAGAKRAFSAQVIDDVRSGQHRDKRPNILQWQSP